MPVQHQVTFCPAKEGVNMSKFPQISKATIEKMCNDFKTESNLAPRTIRFYREALNVIVRILEENGRNVMPWMIDKSDLKWLLDHYKEKEFTVQTRTGYISALRKWTAHYGNNVVKETKIRWPVDMRPNADWLTTAQAEKLLNVPKNPIQDILVHCELCLGMRRIEVLRLTPQSFSGTFVDVLGKGPQGGKPRRIPYHRDTEEIYRRYMEYRGTLVSQAKQTYPVSTVVPESLLIWSSGNRLSSYSQKGNSVDSQLKKLGPEIGYKDLSHHTLRRTFGREMYRSMVKINKVRIPTIAKIMGHDSIEQCLKYFGIDLDDMASAMSDFALGME